jgi:SAM-dependent methyltransferase
MDLRESWNRVAVQYYSRSLPPTTVRYSLLVPTETQLNLLGDVRGKRVLDLGCGSGHNSVALAKAGGQVTGVDISDVQVDLARTLAEQEAVDVSFVRADMADFLSSQPPATYDFVLSTGALPYVEDVESVFALVRRVLHPQGLFVAALDHPLRTITQAKDGKVLCCSSYFARGRDEWDWEQGEGAERTSMHSFHRTVADYANALIDAGFSIRRMLEPEPVAEEADLRAEEMEQLAMVPATLILVSRPSPRKAVTSCSS